MFHGQRVVVTGAASGIGRATAIAFAGHRAELGLLDLDEAGLAETERLLGGTGHVSIRCDVAEVGSVAAAFAQLAGTDPPIRVLVNNAGINPLVDSSDLVDEGFYDRVMGVNVKGIFFCAQEAVRAMGPDRGGVIVNLGSVSGMVGWGGSSVYSASKGAVIALTKALAMEPAPRRIRVNAVCPGSVRTPMVENNFRTSADPELAWQQTASQHPLGRVGTAEEVADAIVFLASPRSAFITGTCLVVDGGFTAR